jgi:DHA1 family tetracycline resistance protein-like MFS transporter
MNEAFAPVPRRAAFAFVFVTVLLDMFAIGIIIPVLPNLVKTFMGGDDARAAGILGIFGTAWALMQFLSMPVLGSLSDRFGRRPIILLSNFGLGLDYILMALAPSVRWLFVGRVISGITAASVSTAGAYIADVTPPEQRAAKFGLLGAAFGAGFVIGPALGGMLGDISPRLPFWVAAALSLTNGLYGLFVLPESLARERRATFSWRKANPVGALRLLRSHPELWGFAWVAFFSNLAHVALPSVAVLYMIHRYNWNTSQVGLLLGGVGVCSVLVQGVLIRPVVKTLGERHTILVALAAGVVGFTIQAMAPNGILYAAGIAVMSLWGLMNPALQGLMTRLVSPSEQGQLQGANSSVLGIASLIGPLLFTQTFALFIDPHRQWHLPGAPFLLSALLLVTSMTVALRVMATRLQSVPAANP